MVTQKWEETRLKGKVKIWITILVMSLLFFLRSRHSQRKIFIWFEDQ